MYWYFCFVFFKNFTQISAVYVLPENNSFRSGLFFFLGGGEHVVGDDILSYAPATRVPPPVFRAIVQGLTVRGATEAREETAAAGSATRRDRLAVAESFPSPRRTARKTQVRGTPVFYLVFPVV